MTAPAELLEAFAGRIAAPRRRVALEELDACMLIASRAATSDGATAGSILLKSRGSHSRRPCRLTGGPLSAYGPGAPLMTPRGGKSLAPRGVYRARPHAHIFFAGHGFRPKVVFEQKWRLQL